MNVKGGGSWVTEFEVLVGIDSRRFGYLGFYTNYLVTPHIRTSLIRHLADRGYVTKAFYPAAGSFYNSAQAFRDYGFSEFLDAEALGLADNWAGLVDREIIEEVLRRDLRAAQAPFFFGAYAARSPEDLYLPVNLYLYAE